jgi:phosphoglucomutase
VEGAIIFTASHKPAEYQGLKFSGPDGGPALPEVTKDIEARAAKMFATSFAQGKPAGSAFPASGEGQNLETIDAAPAYLARLRELVKFDVIKKRADAGGFGIVYDPLHGCGAGYLDRVLAEQGIAAHTICAERDVLFGGTGPDPSEKNLAPLSAAVKADKAHVGLSTDGDADRFGIVDSDGRWIQPNHILGLLYDYLLESRGWKLDAARSVATSEFIDGVAKLYGFKVHQTPVGFKYIGQFSIHGHLPEKDGILACLLVAEMIAARGASIADQLRDLFRRVGREYWPVRENFHLDEDVKAATLERLKGDFPEFLGRRVVSTDRTDGLQLVFTDGAWILMRMSGTEPLMRVYAEAGTLKESQKIADQAREWAVSAAVSAGKGNK